MFTGIVEYVGEVRSVLKRGQSLTITVQVPGDISDSRVGDSFCISGACLTAVRIAGNSVDFDVSGETLQRSTLGSVRVGEKVNVERALKVSGRLGGHIVTGHVDTTGEVVEVAPLGETTRMKIRAGEKVAPYLVEKGSICIDGVSLTLGLCQGSVFFVHLIPHTLKATTLQYVRAGFRVNLEADLIGKYVETLLARRGLVSRPIHEIGKEALEKFGLL